MIALGHSTTPIDIFLQSLHDANISVLADVRTVPRSRHNPQFDQENLRGSLEAAKIGYVWMKELGGFRKTQTDSPNGGWRNASFRGYADYMQTPEFASALRSLIALGPPEQTAFMCSEAVPWRCHRSLIADALLVRKISVQQMMITARGPVLKPHKLTPFAHVEGWRITYPPEQLPLSDKDVDPERNQA